MATQVKCRQCKESVDKDMAYSVPGNKVPAYFCSERCAHLYQEAHKKPEKKPRKHDKCMEALLKITDGEEFNKKRAVFIINNAAETYGFENVESYLCNNIDDIKSIIYKQRTITKSIDKCNYALGIVRKALQYEVDLAREILLEEYEKEDNNELKYIDYDYEYKYKQKKKRKALIDYEMEVSEDG